MAECRFWEPITIRWNDLDSLGHVNNAVYFTYLEMALMSDRNNPQVAYELAVKGQESGRHDAAIKALQNIALSKVSGPMSKAEAYYRQAQIALEQGDSRKALMMGRRAQNTDKELEGIKEFLASLS